MNSVLYSPELPFLVFSLPSPFPWDKNKNKDKDSPIRERIKIESISALNYFLNSTVSKENINNETLALFAKLDDYDIISAMKQWQHHDDFVLSNLSEMIINRTLLKIKLKNKKIKESSLKKHIETIMTKYQISEDEARYFVFTGSISNQAYQLSAKRINILHKSGKIQDIVKASDQLNLKALSTPVTKYYICYPKV